MRQRQGEGRRHEQALHHAKEREDRRLGAKASIAVGTESNNKLSAIARLRSMRAEHADEQAGDGHAERAGIGRQADWDGMTP